MKALPTKRRLKFLGWLLLIALLGWAGTKVSWTATFQALSRFPVGVLAALAALNAAILWLFALRWWWLLRVAGYPIRWGRLTAYRLAAFSVSYFTPGSQFGGEPLQVWALWKQEGVPTADAIASVGLDKLLELVGNFAFLLLGAAAFARLGLFSISLRRGLPLGAGALALGAAVYLALVCRGASPLSRLRRFPLLSTVARHSGDAESAATALCRRRSAVAWWGLGLSLPTWAALIAEYALMTHGLGMRLTLAQILVMMTAARLAFLLPLLPGGLGALEGGLALAAGALGYAPATGLALALIIRLRDLTIGAIGLFLAHRLGAQALAAPKKETAK